MSTVMKWSYYRVGPCKEVHIYEVLTNFSYHFQFLLSTELFKTFYNGSLFQSGKSIVKVSTWVIAWALFSNASFVHLPSPHFLAK